MESDAVHDQAVRFMFGMTLPKIIKIAQHLVWTLKMLSYVKQHYLLGSYAQLISV